MDIRLVNSKYVTFGPCLLTGHVSDDLDNQFCAQLAGLLSGMDLLPWN
jgi:hypothetical protein